jgi:prophage regulatory protein
MPSTRFIPYPELADYGVPYSRKHLLDLQRLGLFPKAIQSGANRVAWIEADVLQWVASRPVARSVQTEPADAA